MRLGKVLVNLAIPMISKLENASPGAILQYYREKNGISKSELADILGMTEYEVVNLEKGFNPIHYKNAVLIGKVLNIDPEELIDEYTRFCLPGFGKKIKAIRAAYGVSQKDFAPIVGVDRSTVSIREAEINEREAYNIIKEMAKEKGVDIS
ncbi:helix-turn-helix transcriptional regulator [Streptococcus equinus]|uniref:helix-turn-helix transcriptional regulator n=1 Tax=Streptococcus equinus TaxID=1335 RepID=UPI0012FA5008|nr:helix-turn-helix transcriptional regulator [Streptococcus equinus]QGX45064.1 helix-turn-helix domain-containing protein [Streptococcus equinus]